MILFLIVFCLLVTVGFGLASAVSDFKSMTIPNIYALGILLAFLPAFAADYLTGAGFEFFASWKSHFGAGLLVFALTFVLFAARVMGAGDSKLCSALALWTGMEGLAPFLFYMAIAGAVLAFATKFLNKRPIVEAPKEGSWIAKSQSGQMGVPYGIAICIGMIISFSMLGYFSPSRLGGLASGYEQTSPASDRAE